MTEAKFRDIVATMIEFGLLDPYKAMLDPYYLAESINMYIQAANVASEMMHMEPLC